MFAVSFSRLSWLGGRLSCFAALPVALASMAGGGMCLLHESSVALAADAESDTVTESRPDAAQVVTQALKAEAEGDLVARDRLLTLAAKTDADCETALWQRGCLKAGGNQWQSIEEAISADRTNASLDDYETRRLITLDNAIGQWQLTLWCLQKGYPDQARAHARRTMELEPNHLAARQLLGFRFVDGQWISAAEWDAFERRATDVRLALEKYGRELKEIARGFRAHSREARAAAREKLMGISEPSAIAPVEALLGSVNIEAAEATLRWLAKTPDPEASKSMVRFAMFHPEARARELAISQLRERPFHDYVPELLQMLASPVASMSLPVLDRNGTLQGFRQAFAQERQGETEVFVLDTRMSYSAGQAANPRRPSARRAANAVRPRSDEDDLLDLQTQVEAYERAGEQVAERNAALQANNRRIEARNQRIAEVISDITNREFSGTPNELWQWWDETNETEHQSLKLSSVRYASTELATRNYTALALAAVSQSSFAHECFVRGTPVVTRRGLRAIETVRVGDLVLSRDVPTGELSWKPVLRTTTRQPRPTYEIALDDESVRCTGGHLLWVSGKGWTKASQLKAGDVLHGAASPAVVMKIEQRPEETTYNLAVEATQTYFVGKQMILSHDVTDRIPTYIKVPGLSPLAAQ